MIWGKLIGAHPTKSGHFAPAYLSGSDKLTASLEVSLCLTLKISVSMYQTKIKWLVMELQIF